MARSKSSQRWLKEHFSDRFVKESQKAGYRARSAFKLLELQRKDHIIRPGMTIVDLGAAPGGWSQVVQQLLQEQGQVFALDILSMAPIAGVIFIQGDFRDPLVLQQLNTLLNDQPVDVVLSDMAPQMSGIKEKDQADIFNLAELALMFAEQALRPGGAFIVKVFYGAGFDSYLKSLRSYFTKVEIRKPQASRDRSSEVYLVAKGFKKT